MKIFLIGLILFSGVSQAQSITLPSSKSGQLSYILGIDSIIDAAKRQSEESANRQLTSLVDQLAKSYPKLTPDQISKIRAAASELNTSVYSSWSAEVVKQIYVQELSERMSAEDTDKALQFFASPAGRNAYVGTRAAEQKMIAYITSSQERAMSEATSRLIESIKTIMTQKPAK